MIDNNGKVICDICGERCGDKKSHQYYDIDISLIDNTDLRFKGSPFDCSGKTQICCVCLERIQKIKWNIINMLGNKKE